MQSYILTYCMLRKTEPLIALGSLRGGGGGGGGGESLMSVFAVPHRKGRGGGVGVETTYCSQLYSRQMDQGRKQGGR